VADGDDLTVARVRSAEGASAGASVPGAAASSKRLAAEVVRRATLRCDRAPEGWYCTRAAGHDGPCAASPNDEIPSEVIAFLTEYADPADFDAAGTDDLWHLITCMQAAAERLAAAGADR
jgi:hypothetical protein